MSVHVAVAWLAPCKEAATFGPQIIDSGWERWPVRGFDPNAKSTSGIIETNIVAYCILCYHKIAQERPQNQFSQ